MDPFLLAIQVPELVGTDVNQGAQVTMISTREKEDMGIGLVNGGIYSWLSPNHYLPFLNTKHTESQSF